MIFKLAICNIWQDKLYSVAFYKIKLHRKYYTWKSFKCIKATIRNFF